MITIGICDDQPEQLELLAGYIRRHSRAAEFELLASSSPEDFLARMEVREPALVFLDVDMEGMNGIELGERLRGGRPGIVIVYVTAHEQYAVQAFRLRAFHYLVKPVTQESIAQVLDEALPKLTTGAGPAPRKRFAVQRKGELARLDYDDIFLFEKTGHKIKITATGGDIEYYGNFSMLLSQLDPQEFLQCHQGYIVNVSKVRSYRDKTLLLEGGCQAPVSRSQADRVRETLAKRLFVRKERV